MKGLWTRLPWLKFVLVAVALALLGFELWRLSGLTLPVSHIAALFGGTSEQHGPPPSATGANPPTAQMGQHVETWQPVKGLLDLANVVWWMTLIVFLWTGVVDSLARHRKKPSRA